MAKFDPKNPPEWVRRMLARAADFKGAHTWAEHREGDGGSPAISLGGGVFVAPLPVGWTLHPARVCEGRLRVKEGYDIAYRLDSYEDPEAAAGGRRLLAYADEPEFKDMVKSPRDILEDFLISIPDRDPLGKDIVWKCVEPFAGTHIRELVLRCPLATAELVEHRTAIARAIGEWLGLGRFAPEPGALDKVAHTVALERVNFEDTVMMRVPRHWKVEIDSEDEGRQLFAVDEPGDRETIWVTSRLVPIPPGTDAGELLAATVEAVWNGPLAASARDWLMRRREELPEDDVLLITSNEEVDKKGEALRRITWIRYGIRDEFLVWAPIHLVTASQYLDEPAQIETEALVDREVRNAILSRPVRERE